MDAEENKTFICPNCGAASLKLDHVDDVGQKWFKCEKCGHQTAKPKTRTSSVSTTSPMPETISNRCGDCAYWMTPNCPFLDDAKKRILLPNDSACDEFYVKPDVEKKRESQADMLVKLACMNAKELFHDDRQVPYIRLFKSNVLSTLRLRSREVKSWMAGLLWQAEEKAPNQEALASAINVLEALCCDGTEYKLYNRIAPSEDGGIWIDMADDKWRAIKVTGEGWQIVDNPPILFRRYSHQKAILEPVKGGDLNELFEFANVKDEGDRLLYIVTSITYLIPNIPHVILVFFGPQGSGKSWSLRVILCLVDPSQLDLLNLPRRPRELVQNLDHHWLAFYDNVGRLPEWCSNVFCRAVTGMGVSKRALYTDDDDVIYSFHRCIGLTDINIAAERGDMLQRSLLLGLDVIPKKQRKTEKQLKAAFEKAGPRIFGAMLDVLVKAIQIYPTIKLEGLHRMADYIVWGCAITEALGKDKQEFLDAYEKNVNQQNLEMVRASPISDALIKLMEEHPLGWEGTASQLFSLLEEKAKELKISTRQKAWPKKPHVLSRRLNELAPSLPVVGYEISRGYKGKTLLICINRCGSYGSPGNAVATAASEGIFENYTGYMFSIKSWCLTQRNERGEINLEDLAKFIKEELKQEPNRVIKEAFDHAILMPSPQPGKAVVV